MSESQFNTFCFTYSIYSHFNTFWPNEAIWRYISGSILARVIDFVRQVPKPMMIFSGVQWH